jgi:hypothetical protein
VPRLPRAPPLVARTSDRRRGRRRTGTGIPSRKTPREIEVRNPPADRSCGASTLALQASAAALDASRGCLGCLNTLQSTRDGQQRASATVHESAQALRFDRKTIEQKVRRHIDGWRALLSTKHVQDGRQLLREVLAGPLRFTPEGRTYRFEGHAALGGMFAGIADVATLMVAVRGIEPRFDG